MTAPLTCFKAYDVRGRLGDELDEAVAGRIGAAFAAVMAPRLVVLGRDVRLSSEALAGSVARALNAAGVDVVDLGLVGTEEVYFATGSLGADGGIQVTASHNPIDYNGLKLVGPSARPMTGDEFADLRAAAERGAAPAAARPGALRREDRRPAYAAHVAGMVDPARIGPLRLVVNAGHGGAGPAFDAIETRLRAGGARIEVTRLHHEPDGRFPAGIPNPLLPENREVTARAVRQAGADVGLAWDGDFDRCFFFDETGTFVDGEHVVALLAAACLGDEPGARIVHDARVIWNTEATVAAGGGVACMAPTGHVHMKRRMREVDAVYGGEISAHHYFRDFYYCDSGMIPWVKILALLSDSGRPLSELVGGMRTAFPTSGEINFRVADVAGTLARVETALSSGVRAVDRLDGLSMDFGTWRLNLRGSSTEPLLRLNMETRGDRALLERELARVRSLIDPPG